MNGSGEVNFQSIQVGDALPELRATMDRETYFAYNQLIRNMNPLHSDQNYAMRMGYRDIVVAGVYTFSFIPKMIEDWIGPAGRVAAIAIKYASPIYIGGTIVQTARVTRKSSSPPSLEIEVTVRDLNGNTLKSATVKLEPA
ncbi:MAG TPA: MaoC/PaaZ C-terminal domain-containing protein [bacterium]|nr:MaoC/PaaZ C-terminal domain-containing protein [bacterium]